MTKNNVYNVKWKKEETIGRRAAWRLGAGLVSQRALALLLHGTAVSAKATLWRDGLRKSKTTPQSYLHTDKTGALSKPHKWPSIHLSQLIGGAAAALLIPHQLQHHACRPSFWTRFSKAPGHRTTPLSGNTQCGAKPCFLKASCKPPRTSSGALSSF